MGRLNLHRLYTGSVAIDGYEQNISLTPDAKHEFALIREDVRDRLRTDFRALNEAAPSTKAVLLQKSFRTIHRAAELKLRPKFRQQGSFAYFTVNDPAHKPPQQVDLDDGVYLPMSFINLQEPAVAAEAYFDAVENSLRPLCRERGWELDTSPSSCVRIILSDHAHLDLPLYAIPDQEFAEETSLQKSMHSSSVFLDEAVTMAMDRQVRVLKEEQYRAVPADRLMLAKREGGWQKSDPRKLEDWFNEEKARYGDVLRFTCRYLKAWRDYIWPVPKTGPSSICLMACAVDAFAQLESKPENGRHDTALLEVARLLPAIFSGTIVNPADGEARDLDAEWEADKRAEFIRKAEELFAALSRAQTGPLHHYAVAELRRCLGDRVPDDASLVRGEEEERILRTPPRTVAAPVVGRSTSG